MSEFNLIQTAAGQGALDYIRALLVEEEKTKKEAARVLHENKTILAAMRLFVQSIGNDTQNTNLTANHTSQLKELIDNMVNDLRKVSNDLYPQLFKHFGFTKSLLAFKSDLESQELIDIECNDLIIEEPVIDNMQSLFIYRLFTAVLTYLYKEECIHLTVTLSCFNNVFAMEFMATHPVLKDENSEKELNLIRARVLCADAVIEKETNWQNHVKITVPL